MSSFKNDDYLLKPWKYGISEKPKGKRPAPPKGYGVQTEYSDEDFEIVTLQDGRKVIRRKRKIRSKLVSSRKRKSLRDHHKVISARKT